MISSSTLIANHMEYFTLISWNQIVNVQIQRFSYKSSEKFTLSAKVNHLYIRYHNKYRLLGKGIILAHTIGYGICTLCIKRETDRDGWVSCSICHRLSPLKGR